MPWFPRDFASSTRTWPLIARGAYRELLDLQWDIGHVPPDPRQLRSLIGATPTEWRLIWQHVEGKFPLSNDGLRRNARLEAHRSKAMALAERQRAGARSTNEKLWGHA